MFRKKSSPQTLASNTVTVEQVHNEIYSLADELEKISLENLGLALPEKGNRLKAFGFSNVPEVVERDEIERRKREATEVEQYKLRYPGCKIISEAALTTVCKKYGLIVGSLDQYKGEVPGFALRDMEGFTIHHEDVVSKRSDRREQRLWGHYPKIDFTEIMLLESGDLEGFKKHREQIEAERTRRRKLSECRRNIYIAATADVMKLDPFDEVRGVFVVEKDPIILYPLGKNHFVIVTAWGAEAGDKDVQNEQLN